MHRNSYHTIVAGIAVVRNKDGKYLFMRRSDQEAYAAGKWDFPGGAKEFLESPEEGALRECKEESGLDVSLKKFLWYRVSQGGLNPNNEFVAFFYLCESESEYVSLSPEHDQYQWLDLEEGRKLDPIPWMKDFYQQIDEGKIDLNL
jgi:8-oxo-dGTP diphosphatase